MAGRPLLHSDDELRVRIDDAAVRVFVSKGYIAATIDEIARLASVRKPALYRLHASKSALYRHLIQDFAGAVADRAMAAASETRSGDRLAGIIDAWFTVIEADPLRWQLLANAVAHDPETAETLQAIRRMQIANDALLIRTLSPGIPEAEVAPLAEAIHAALVAVGQWWLANQTSEREIPIAAIIRFCRGIALTAT